MALKEEEINSLVDRVRNALKSTGTTPFSRVKKTPEYNPTYSESIKLMDAVKIHSEIGEFPEALFKLRSPNETDVEQKYRKDIYKQITLPVFADYMNTQSRAFADSNWSVEYSEEKEAYKDESFKVYVEREIKTYKSVEAFIFNILTTKKAIDANGVLVIKPYELLVNDAGEIDAETLIEPIPYYYPCNRVLFFNEDYYLLESLEKSVVDYGNIKRKEGYVYELFDDETIYKIIQVGKYLDYTFEVKVYFRHNIGEVPVKRLMGIPKLIEDEVIYQSPFRFVTDNLDLAILDASNLAISKSRTAFPVPVTYGQICDFTDKEGNRCMDGIISTSEGDESCKMCSGSGLKTRLNPMTGILLKPATRDDDGDKGMSQEPLKYVSPSSEILTFLDGQIDKHIDRARKILHLPDADVSVQGNEGATATGSNNKLKSLYAFLKPISDQVFDLYEFALNSIGYMRYGDNFNPPKINRPVSFDFKTESDYLFDIGEAIKNQMPPMALHTILYRYLNTFYYNETNSAKVLNLIVSVDRLFGLTMEQITMKLARNLASPYEDVLHNSAITLIQELLMTNEKFLDLDLSVQMEQLIDKAKEKADELKVATPRTILI